MTKEALAKTYGKYRLVHEIGQGGLGLVYKAIDETTGKSYAIKFLHEKYLNDRKFLGIFHKELLIMSRLQHKHIVPFVDSVFDPPHCYIVTQFIDGFSGYRLIKLIKRIPPLVALSIGIDILKAIDYLHLHDTIHSDMSSANYLIDHWGRVYITDFGLSCQMHVEDYKKYMLGTPGYYSPEHISDRSVTHQSDLYCVALILYELITGTKAIAGKGDRHAILQRMQRIPLSLAFSSDDALNVMIIKFMKIGLAYSQHNRFQTAEQMIHFIYKILSKYRIRYARYAIHQYLSDASISKFSHKGLQQEIYKGFT